MQDQQQLEDAHQPESEMMLLLLAQDTDPSPVVQSSSVCLACIIQILILLLQQTRQGHVCILFNTEQSTLVGTDVSHVMILCMDGTHSTYHDCPVNSLSEPAWFSAVRATLRLASSHSCQKIVYGRQHSAHQACIQVHAVCECTSVDFRFYPRLKQSQHTIQRHLQ